MNSALNYGKHDEADSLVSRRKSSITEVVTTGEDDGLEMLMPMLAHLSRESKDRWFTWVAPKQLAARVNKQALLAYGFALDKVRIVLPDSNDALLRFVWDALANGTSANVVANLEGLSENERFQLEKACQHGESRGLILRTR